MGSSSWNILSEPKCQPVSFRNSLAVGCFVMSMNASAWDLNLGARTFEVIDMKMVNTIPNVVIQDLEFEAQYRRINEELKHIEGDGNLKQYGFEGVCASISANLNLFIRECQALNGLRTCHISPRKNGTLLLIWDDDEVYACVNLGESDFSGVIMDASGEVLYSCKDIISNVKSIKAFYKSLLELYA